MLGAGRTGRAGGCWAGVGRAAERAGTALGERRWAGAGARRKACGQMRARRARRQQAAGAGDTGVMALGARG